MDTNTESLLLARTVQPLGHWAFVVTIRLYRCLLRGRWLHICCFWHRRTPGRASPWWLSARCFCWWTTSLQGRSALNTWRHTRTGECSNRGDCWALANIWWVFCAARLTARPQTRSRPTFTPFNSSLTFLPETAAYAQFNLIFHFCVTATEVRYLFS